MKPKPWQIHICWFLANVQKGEYLPKFSLLLRLAALRMLFVNSCSTPYVGSE